MAEVVGDEVPEGVSVGLTARDKGDRRWEPEGGYRKATLLERKMPTRFFELEIERRDSVAENSHLPPQANQSLVEMEMEMDESTI